MSIAGGTYGDAYGTAALPANTWTHLAVTYDGSTVRLYVNGTQVGSVAHTGAIATSTNPLQIGGDSIYGQYFVGLIDEVRVYNTALTAVQIQADMTTPVTPSGPDTQPPTAPASRPRRRCRAARSICLAGRDRQRGRDRLSGGALPRCRLHHLRPGRDADRDQLQRHDRQCGHRYSYRVRATDSAGNLGSYTPTASATTPAPDTQPPTGPASLAATAVSGGEIDLSWPAATDNVGVSGYQVERCTGAGCSSFVQVATPTATSYKDTTVSAGTAYSYRVRATDSAGNLGSYTPTASATTPAPITYSVGGSVSGLSGTVVLQDNGGDDLSVSANGSFTFATKLVDAAAYSVTVETNPFGSDAAASRTAPAPWPVANVTGVAVACATSSTPTDDFNRADGGLGANWSAVSDGALSISSQAVLGTSATAGDIRVGETYAGDQSSQVEVTSTQLSGGQWIGPAVRMQPGGQDLYLGIYFWNNGTQQLRLYKRSAGTWIQLGSSFNSGALPAGTQLKLTAIGSTISFLQNGLARVTATDSTVIGGAPGIMTFGTAKADNWVGGGASSSPPPTYSIGGSVVGSSGTRGVAGQRR